MKPPTARSMLLFLEFALGAEKMTIFNALATRFHELRELLRLLVGSDTDDLTSPLVVWSPKFPMRHRSKPRQ